MKAYEVLKRLRAAGWMLEEGKKHTLAVSPDGKKQVAIPRHTTDLKPGTLHSIQKATGVSMK